METQTVADNKTNREPVAENTYRFEAEVDQVLRLVINSLYSNKEIFLRELLSNASDALDKLRFEAVTNAELTAGEALEIQLEVDATEKSLTISDTGIGMSKAELIQNLGTIAKSGTSEFREQLKKAAEAKQSGDVQLIGQFGVGFYSAWLVADRVEVVSKRAGTQEAWRWSSDAKQTFTVEPAERRTHGTTVKLFLNSESADYLRTWKLEELVRKYSDYVHWPIQLREEKEKDQDLAQYKTINKGTALWQRLPSEVSAEQYAEFYKHLSHDWEEPLTHKHFKVEGTQEFSGLLFVPRRPPFDLFNPESKHGVRLYVKRVFIMEDCEQVLPKWLRFVRGVVDSEDLPLNVSREILQDSRTTKVIRKSVTTQVLNALAELAKDKPEDYLLFSKNFGAVLKEGLHFEPELKDKLLPLLRFESSTEAGLTSLAAYITRMKEGQDRIYVAVGESKKQLESSPHIEGLKKRGYEVLFLVDAVDQWILPTLTEFDGKKIASATSANLDGIELSDEEKKALDDAKGKLSPVTDKFRALFQDRVEEVRLSSRLTDSPLCLVTPEGGLSPHLERLMRMSREGMPLQKRILELNPTHPIIVQLAAKLEAGKTDEVEGLMQLLFDQALIAEGSPLEDPGAFAARITKLLTQNLTGGIS